VTDASHEPASDAAARAAQVAAMTLSVAEALARLRAQHLFEQRIRQRQLAAAHRASQAAARTAARQIWTPAMNRSWLRNAPTPDLLAAWSAAQPWTYTDPLARLATTRLEQRLLERHPEAMRRYQQARADGHHPAVAMRDAATSFEPRPAIDMPRGDAALRTGSPLGPADVIVGESFPTPIDESLSSVRTTAAIAVTTLPASPERQHTHKNRGQS
jgi:hypothetical protein